MIPAALARPRVAIYNLRDAAGLSQQDLADAINALAVRRGGSCGITANQVGRWERGTVRPQPLYRRLLAEFFGVSVADLGLTAPRPVPGDDSQAVGHGA